MKIKLAAKNDDVKDNHPAWDVNTCLESVKDKSQQQKERIHNDGAVTQYHQGPFQPGKRYYLVGAPLLFILELDIPKYYRQ